MLGKVAPAVWLFPYEDTAPPPTTTARLELPTAVLLDTRIIEFEVFAWKPAPLLDTTHWSTSTAVVPPAVCCAKTPAEFWVNKELKTVACALLPNNRPLEPFAWNRE